MLKQEPITCVTWKWDSKLPRAKEAAWEFTSAQVNILRAMFERCYPEEHRFVCITDNPKGLDPRIEVIAPCPVTFDWVQPPQGERFPSSFRRLWNFSYAARELLGPRIFAVDIDTVFCGDLRPLLLGAREDFISWWDPRFRWNKIPGGIYLHRTGTLPHIWYEFNPDRSPAIVAASRCGREKCRGSDQGWMSYRLFDYVHSGKHNAKAWTCVDGVWSLKWMKEGKPMPRGVRVICTPGYSKPWSSEVQEAYPWIAEHWRL